jgi:hypothetical protein
MDLSGLIKVSCFSWLYLPMDYVAECIIFTIVSQSYNSPASQYHLINNLARVVQLIKQYSHNFTIHNRIVTDIQSAKPPLSLIGQI